MARRGTYSDSDDDEVVETVPTKEKPVLKLK